MNLKRNLRSLLLVAAFVVVTFEGVSAKDRVYFIGVKEIEWDYTPSGKNLIKDVEFSKDG